MELSEIRKELKKALKKERYEHSEGVAYTSAALAMRYDPSLVDKALVAGLLHDCAKYLSVQTMLDLCEEGGYDPGEKRLQNTGLLHAKAGAVVVRKKYKINDPDIVSAILWHTTGKIDMTLLEKILYVADFIEPNRTKIDAKIQEHLRRVAFSDIDRAVYEIAKHCCEYLSKKSAEISPLTAEVCKYYEEVCRSKEEK
ncbi:MAG: bis(5'-nucleosyl)-tetraphosphatase (symmetrical) YqeK [Lachnospiraceae bacterium]|nr:bis(5'-nucleosyl)-tetraphosphatase (symmetrical) YqeK [Lachnospiraceae bacterium]